MADIQFLEYVGYVGLDGAFAGGQVRCDLFVGGHSGAQLQNLDLAVGGDVAAAIGVGTLARKLGQPSKHLCSNLGFDLGFAPMDDPNGSEQLLVGGVLEQVALGSGLDGVENILVGVIGGQDDDLCFEVSFAYGAHGLDACHLRHTQVHEDNV